MFLWASLFQHRPPHTLSSWIWVTAFNRLSDSNEIKGEADCPLEQALCLFSCHHDLNLELMKVARLTGQSALNICLSLPSQCWRYKYCHIPLYLPFKWVLGITGTLVLMLTGQALYHLSHLQTHTAYFSSAGKYNKIPDKAWHGYNCSYTFQQMLVEATALLCMGWETFVYHKCIKWIRAQAITIF